MAIIRVTQVHVVPSRRERLLGFATITLADAFVVKGLRIIQSSEDADGRPFVAMPNRRLPDGSFHDVAHPIDQEMRDHIEEQVLNAYFETVGSERSPD